MHHRKLGFTVASAGLLLAGGAAHADNAASITTLEDVVVTATKREEKLKDVAMSITAVVGDDLARRAETGFADFAAQVPGLSLQVVDAGASRVILRGQNVGSVGATIATTVDDIPFFMSGAQSDGAYLSANIDTFDLNRVEVLRGPQGTLYGAAAEGGLIKYVTNAPDPSKYAANLVLGGQFVAGGDKGAYEKAMVNLPVLDGMGALRISASNEALPGWVNNKSNNVQAENHGQKHSVRASLLLKPLNELTVRLTAFNQDISQRGSGDVEVVGAAYTPQTPPSDQFTPIDGLSHRQIWPTVTQNHLEYYALSVDYSLPFAEVFSSTSYGKLSYASSGGIQDGTFAILDPANKVGFTYGDAFNLFVYGQPIAIVGHQVDYVNKFNQELRLSSKNGNTLFGHGFDWQVGGFVTRESTGLVQPYEVRALSDLTTVLDPPIGGAVIPGYYKETAVFADATFHFSDAFDVEAGARETNNKQSSQVKLSCCVLYGGDTTFPALPSKESGHTWSVAPRWHISKDTLLYGRVATGFRPGGPNLPVPGFENPPPFKSDSTRNYEIGFRTELGRVFSIDVALFKIDWNDVQILFLEQTASGPVGINGNSGRATSKGVEWNFGWRPTEGLKLEFLGAYTDAKLKDSAPGIGAFAGDELPYVPKTTFTFNADYQWHAFADWNAFIGGSLNFTGARYTGFSPSVTVIEPHVKLPSYDTTKIQLGLDNGRYSVELYVNNLSDQRGITDYNNSGGHDFTGRVNYIQPRTFGVQLGAKF